jgi:predicted Fe-Mo cluster-binding NifX family protein
MTNYQVWRLSFLSQDLWERGVGGSMRIAVTTQGDGLEAEVDPRFGRTARFLLVETSTMETQLIENARNLDLPQGAGIQAAQSVMKFKPDVVLTGNCGPKAFQVLQAAGIQVVVGVKGRIRDAVQAFVEGRYRPATEANVEGHWA